MAVWAPYPLYMWHCSAVPDTLFQTSCRELFSRVGCDYEMKFPPFFAWQMRLAFIVEMGKLLRMHKLARQANETGLLTEVEPRCICSRLAFAAVTLTC